jgi:glucose-1-phosphate cytidylyltransferase
MIDEAKAKDVSASFLAVRPNYTFHTIDFNGDGRVSGVRNVVASDIWVNGGYFVLRSDIFDYLHEGEELVVEAFGRLVEREGLSGWQHEGFWAPMDTLKEQQELEAMVESGGGPWRVWANGQREATPPPPSDR